MEACIMAMSFLPPRLRRLAEGLSVTQKAQAEEFRLRAGRPFSVTLAEGIQVPDESDRITSSDIELMVETATGGSLHTVLDRVCNGFVTVDGGHRLGLCGTAVMQAGEIANLRDLSSCCLRVAREKKGVAERVLPALWAGNDAGILPNVLIVSPPGGGKTTLLRDLIRALSAGGAGRPPLRVGVADERGELAGCRHGAAQLDVGPNTDILDAAPKAIGALLLLKALSPQVVALDEITAPEDVEAVTKLCHCGVSVLATAHAESREELLKRALYRPLAEVFQKMITVEGKGAARRYSVTDFAAGRGAGQLTW